MLKIPSRQYAMSSTFVVVLLITQSNLDLTFLVPTLGLRGDLRLCSLASSPDVIHAMVYEPRSIPERIDGNISPASSVS